MFRRQTLCTEMAKEWANDVSNHVSRFTLPYENPKILPSITIKDGDSTRKYSEGKLYNLNTGYPDAKCDI